MSSATRLSKLEATLEVLIQAAETRLNAIEEAHNRLDARFEDLFYRILFVMEHITVRRKVQGTIITGADTEERTLMEFYTRDGEAWIAQMKREADALAENLAAIDARRCAPDAALAEAVAPPADDVPVAAHAPAPASGRTPVDDTPLDFLKRTGRVAGSRRPF